jgi:hypothetical protein
MRLKGIKDLTLGKIKDKDKEEEEGANQESKIAEMGNQINNRTKNLEETTQQLQELSDKNGDSPNGDEPEVKPHGPLSELQVEPGEEEDELDLASVISESELQEADEDVLAIGDGGPEIKVVELSKPTAETETSETKAEESKPEESAGEDDTFNNLFSDEEDEENPLDSLITSLPDVTTEEIMDDIKEIKDIIQEWQHN